MIEEDLLQAWIASSVCIRGNRLLKELSFNEIIICNTLYHHGRMTATDLCNKTRLLKSQVNKVLTGMEKKQLITRERDKSDHRRLYVSLNESHTDVYLHEHDHVLSIMSEIKKEIGEENMKILTDLLNRAATVVNDLQE